MRTTTRRNGGVVLGGGTFGVPRLLLAMIHVLLLLLPTVQPQSIDNDENNDCPCIPTAFDLVLDFDGLCDWSGLHFDIGGVGCTIDSTVADDEDDYDNTNNTGTIMEKARTTDLVPVVIREYRIIETDPSTVGEYEIAHVTNLDWTATATTTTAAPVISYSSPQSTDYTLGGLQVHLYGENAAGESIYNKWIVRYNCTLDVPHFYNQDSLGWTTFQQVSSQCEERPEDKDDTTVQVYPVDQLSAEGGSSDNNNEDDSNNTGEVVQVYPVNELEGCACASPSRWTWTLDFDLDCDLTSLTETPALGGFGCVVDGVNDMDDDSFPDMMIQTNDLVPVNITKYSIEETNRDGHVITSVERNFYNEGVGLYHGNSITFYSMAAEGVVVQTLEVTLTGVNALGEPIYNSWILRFNHTLCTSDPPFHTSESAGWLVFTSLTHAPASLCPLTTEGNMGNLILPPSAAATAAPTEVGVTFETFLDPPPPTTTEDVKEHEPMKSNDVKIVANSGGSAAAAATTTTTTILSMIWISTGLVWFIG